MKEDVIKLECMLNSLSFGKEIQGKSLGGIVITKSRNQIHIGYCYGYYGLLNYHEYFNTAKDAVKWLSRKGVSVCDLKVGYDPSLFNGL